MHPVERIRFAFGNSVHPSRAAGAVGGVPYSSKRRQRAAIYEEGNTSPRPRLLLLSIRTAGDTPPRQTLIMPSSTSLGLADALDVEVPPLPPHAWIKDSPPSLSPRGLPSPGYELERACAPWLNNMCTPLN